MPGAPVCSVEDYIAGLPEDVRATAEAVRLAIRAAAPDTVEMIRYGMPAFVLNGKAIIHFAVWKKHVGLYPVYRGADDVEQALAAYRVGKDTVRFILKDPVPLDLVARIVVSQMQSGQR